LFATPVDRDSNAHVDIGYLQREPSKGVIRVWIIPVGLHVDLAHVESQMPNKSIGAAAVIVNDEGGVLLVKQTYGRLNWELPGGAAEVGESPDETALREVREEAGLVVAALHLTGYYHDAEADFLHFVFLCEVHDRDSTPRPDLREVSECRYWPPEALPRPISDFTIRRIQEAMAGVKFSLPSRVGPRVWIE
jgi:8-oxo-dGTP diphosphatase